MKLYVHTLQTRESSLSVYVCLFFPQLLFGAAMLLQVICVLLLAFTWTVAAAVAAAAATDFQNETNTRVLQGGVACHLALLMADLCVQSARKKTEKKICFTRNFQSVCAVVRAPVAVTTPPYLLPLMPPPSLPNTDI